VFTCFSSVSGIKYSRFSSRKLKLCSSDGHFSGDYSGEGSSDVNDLKVPMWVCDCRCVLFIICKMLDLTETVHIQVSTTPRRRSLDGGLGISLF
jgi:hypothetical protein